MRRRFAMVFVLFALDTVCLRAGAQAQTSGFPCDAFVKNPDGSWSAIRDTAIPGIGDFLNIRTGSILRPGATIRGLDLAATLDQACPMAPAPASTPVSAPATAAQPPASESHVALGQYADANGNIDVQRLTCGQLADASPQEGDLFLAWYNGWYNGLAKKRGINLARVRYAIHNVVDYCRGNRDKRMVQVMDLMLK